MYLPPVRAWHSVRCWHYSWEQDRHRPCSEPTDSSVNVFGGGLGLAAGDSDFNPRDSRCLKQSERMTGISDSVIVCAVLSCIGAWHKRKKKSLLLILCLYSNFSILLIMNFCISDDFSTCGSIMLFILIAEFSWHIFRFCSRDECLHSSCPNPGPPDVFLISKNFSAHTGEILQPENLGVSWFMNGCHSDYATGKMSGQSNNHYFEGLLCTSPCVSHEGHKVKALSHCCGGESQKPK